MPTKIEKDSVTGHMTTGHEWDGLQELNRPLPKWWLYVLWATVAAAVVLCVLYPSVPGITGYWHGLLGYSQRTSVDQAVAEVAAQRAGAMDRIKALSFADIRKDPQLLAVAETAGRITFANNCQPCHGAGGGGNPGYPALAAGNWLWGGKLEEIQQTVTHGIRSGDSGRAPEPDAALRRGRHPEAGANPAGRRLRDDAVRHAGGGRGRCAGQGAVRRQLRRLPWRRQGRAIARSARRGWPRASICTATTARRWWRRSPIRRWA